MIDGGKSIMIYFLVVIQILIVKANWYGVKLDFHSSGGW